MKEAWNRMVRWWWTPLPVASIAPIRFGLGVICVVYFIDAMTDAAFWFGTDGVHSSRHVAEFLQRSGLQDAAAASISPLFLTDVLWVYQAYLLLGIGLATTMMLGRGGRAVSIGVWLMLVFWANRLLWLAGLTETTLCLCVFATCLAPTWKVPLGTLPKWKMTDGNRAEISDSPVNHVSSLTGISMRLTAVQVTSIALATWLSMLAGDVWWNGTGAVALAVPESIRTLSLVDFLRASWVHEPITLAIMVALPMGVWMAWGRDHSRLTRWWGAWILVGWALTIAILGSHWIYGATLACAFATIPRVRSLGPELSHERGRAKTDQTNA